MGQQIAKDAAEIKELESDVNILKTKVEALQERRVQLLLRLKPLLRELNMLEVDDDAVKQPMDEKEFEDWLRKLQQAA